MAELICQSQTTLICGNLEKAKLSYNDDLLVFPGHGYSKPNTTIGEEKRIGLLGITKSQWMSAVKKEGG